MLSRGEGHRAGVWGLPPPGSGRNAARRDRLGCDGVQLDGMGQGTKVVGRGGTAPPPHSSLGLQGEGQLDAGELLPAAADGHPDAVVAIGHPGRQLHIRQDEVTGWQGVGALQREGTCRQDASQTPPAPRRRAQWYPAALPASCRLGGSGVPL